MTVSFRVEPGLIRIFARSVADTDPAYSQQQFSRPDKPVVAPPTFTRAIAEQFDDDAELQRNAEELIPVGGSGDRLHAEQHFEYVRPLRAHEILSATSRAGRTWRKRGRTGDLRFTEFITDFLDSDGALVIRSRRVGVRLGEGKAE